MKGSISFRAMFLATALLFLLSACDATRGGLVSQDQKEILKERATAYWQHKINESFEKAYLYEDSFLRKKMSLTDYLQMGVGVKWLEVDIKDVVIDGKNARVKVWLRYISTMGNYVPKDGRKRTISDYWVFENNSWYHVIGARK